MSVETKPGGFYAVCATGRERGSGYFWAAWWTSSGLAATPKPDAHGLTDRVEEAHAKARAAILAARGAQARVLHLDADLAVEAARVVLPRVDWRSREREEAHHGWRRPAPAPRAWLGVLGLTWPCTAAEVRRAYRRLALQHHPDRGGTVEGFTRITEARDAALREV